MKKEKFNQQLSLREITSGRLTGGFTILTTREAIIAGTEDPINNCHGGCSTNNCNGGNCGNCVLGCGNQS